VLRKQSAAGNRVLIFTPFTKTLDLIQNYIKANGYTFLRMDGSIPQPKRQPLIFKFQNDPNIFIFLLSTKATGVGITLTVSKPASSVVIPVPSFTSHISNFYLAC
jgi:SNF2 family DNA or RNA helicase